MEYLQLVRLDHCGLSDEEATLIATLFLKRNIIKELNLTRNDLTDDFIKSFCKQMKESKNNSLEILELNNNDMRDIESIKKLYDSAKNSSIKTIGFCLNGRSE